MALALRQLNPIHKNGRYRKKRKKAFCFLLKSHKVEKFSSYKLQNVCILIFVSRFLADEDDDVSEAVFEFCHAYLGIMKQLKNELIEDNNRIKNMLLVVIQKMKIDEEFDFDEEVTFFC